MPAQLKVEGVPEVTRALSKVASEIQDLSEAHRAEGEMLMPSVQSATRRQSGALVEGWAIDGMATEVRFSNPVVYAGVQEFGWSEHGIEPTNAIAQAFSENEQRTEEIYGNAIGRIGDRAGFQVD